jgi:hypothetical protein
MATPHMLPSTSLNVSAPAMFCISQLNIPPHAIVVYASQPPSPANHATLTTGRPLRPTRTGLAPARQRQLPGAPAKQSRRDAPRPLDGLPSPAARRASLAVALIRLFLGPNWLRRRPSLSPASRNRELTGNFLEIGRSAVKNRGENIREFSSL